MSIDLPSDNESHSATCDKETGGGYDWCGFLEASEKVPGKTPRDLVPRYFFLFALWSGPSNFVKDTFFLIFNPLLAAY
jgi:hypothetical protein